MDLRVIENLETELSIEIAGEDHTFMNVLKAALLSIEPLDALEAAADGVTDKTGAFREAFEAAA
ncbi:hypothetical protein BRD05_10365 [Halobacteriales archaeon QS_9_70_65]|nr:MAG: hypothetical protein BRD05_10365 [Halobacteriales archaeon QS_9_70_65]